MDKSITGRIESKTKFKHTILKNVWNYCQFTLVNSCIKFFATSENQYTS